MSVESCKEGKGPSGVLEVKKSTHEPPLLKRKTILAAPNLVGRLINLWKKVFFLPLSVPFKINLKLSELMSCWA